MKMKTIGQSLIGVTMYDDVTEDDMKERDRMLNPPKKRRYKVYCDPDWHMYDEPTYDDEPNCACQESPCRCS
jgi:hypothetical protein